MSELEDQDALSMAYDAGYALGERVRQNARDRIFALEADLAARDARVRVLEELLRDVLCGTVNTSMYPDGPCLDRDVRDEIRKALKGADDGQD